MTDTEAVEESKAAAEELKPAGRQRSPLERAVVWGGIGLLMLLVFFEYNSKTKFEKARQWASDNEYAKKSLAEVRDAFAGARETDLDSEGAADSAELEKEFKWPSLFMKYKLVATFRGVGEEAQMTGFYNPDDLAAVQEEQAAKFSQEVTGSSAPDLNAFGPNGPIEGGGRPGDDEPGEDAGDDESGDSESGDTERPQGSDEPDATEEATEEDSEASKPDEGAGDDN
ncbi:MAG: hypothetical protein NXI04_24070 [Planctomycetaceae bacterium]|nr:hypothetical protein [Planctomycetaceae bacterium]